MPDDVIKLKRDFEKAVENGDKETLHRILDVLDTVEANVEMLSKTGIAIALGRLRKCQIESILNDKKLLSKNMDLINKWKKCVGLLKKTSSSSSSTSSPPPPLQNAISPSAQPTANGNQVGKEVTHSSADAESHSHFLKFSKDECSTIDHLSVLCPPMMDPSRKNMRELLFKDATKNSENLDITALTICYKISDLEESLYTTFCQGLPGVSDSYKEQFRNIRFNLNKNSGLFMGFYGGSLPAIELATMSSDDMMSDKMRQLVEKYREEAFQGSRCDWLKGNDEKINESVGISGSGMFPCPRCKSKRTTFYELQTRSADEPMTIFKSCFNCGFRWRG